MAGKYNFIYEKLVTSDDDLTGLIAYGIYKKHKIEFIAKIKDEESRNPTDEECQSFFIASSTESQLKKYRDQAETILAETVANVASEEIARYEQDMLKNYRAEIKNCLPSNWRTVWLSILSSFAFSVIVAIVYFVALTSERSTSENVDRIMESLQPPVEQTEPDSLNVSQQYKAAPDGCLSCAYAAKNLHLCPPIP